MPCRECTGTRNGTETATKEDIARFACKNFPFNKTTEWLNLSLRRLAVYAAENGYDGISWTPGKQQADRYDLSKQLTAIDWGKNQNGTYDVQGNLINGGFYTKRKP